jgi:hypothetical protein
VWQARKDYDASVADNVKNATDQSPPQLQTRKAMWLQNRAILNTAINDMKSGLGKTAQEAFDAMSDMYGAKENILSKAKVDTKGKEGILPRTAKDLAKKVVGGAVIGEAARRVITGGF